jgi:L-ribulose-5-phosphate 4-epimerase
VSESGSVKFACEHTPKALPSFPGLRELNRHRGKLLRMRLVGEDEKGIGFGNLSVRDGTTDKFFVTGSGTGGKEHLELTDFAHVVSYDLTRNWLRCEGATIASSESLTHAAVYQAERQAFAIVHAHDVQRWAALRDRVPTTPSTVAYGTPEMAESVFRLFRTTALATHRLFVMGGHEGGLVTFGKDFVDAFDALITARPLAGN